MGTGGFRLGLFSHWIARCCNILTLSRAAFSLFWLRRRRGRQHTGRAKRPWREQFFRGLLETRPLGFGEWLPRCLFSADFLVPGSVLGNSV